MRGRIATNVYLNVRKTKKNICEFWNKGIRKLFMHNRGVSTPHVCHKEQQPLIKYTIKIMWLQNYLFSQERWIFLFFFSNRQGCFPYSYISPSAMRKSELRSSLGKNICVLNWFFYLVLFIGRISFISTYDEYLRAHEVSPRSSVGCYENKTDVNPFAQGLRMNLQRFFFFFFYLYEI